MTDLPDPVLPSEVLWSGRGANALIAFLREAAPPGSGVVVPVNLCAVAVAAIIWSDLRPVFHDVSEIHGNAEIHHLDAVDTSNCKILLAVHNFGRSIDLASFRTWADARNMLLVEDVCNAVGGTYQDRPIGQIGDAAFYSFNHGKIVACGHGGAISVRDPRLRKLVARAIEDMPAFAKTHATAMAQLDCDLRAARISGVENAQYAALERYRAFAQFRAAPDWPSSIMRAIGNLPSNLKHRRLLSERYRRMISTEVAKHAPLGDEAAPWRYSILVPPDCRDALLSHLRTVGIHASAWYPPVHRIFAPDTDAVFPEAENFAARVINLWVDTDVDIAAVDRTSLLVNRFFDESAA